MNSLRSFLISLKPIHTAALANVSDKMYYKKTVTAAHEKKSFVLPTATNWFIHRENSVVWVCKREFVLCVCMWLLTLNTRSESRQAPICKNYDMQKPSAVALLNHELMWSCRTAARFNTKKGAGKNAFVSFGPDCFLDRLSNFKQTFVVERIWLMLGLSNHRRAFLRFRKSDINRHLVEMKISFPVNQHQTLHWAWRLVSLQFLNISLETFADRDFRWDFRD